jgi:hypothetical protein
MGWAAGIGCLLGIIGAVVIVANNGRQLPAFKKRAREILKSGMIEDHEEVDRLIVRLNGTMAGPEGKHLAEKLLELKDKSA